MISILSASVRLLLVGVKSIILEIIPYKFLHETCICWFFSIKLMPIDMEIINTKIHLPALKITFVSNFFLDSISLKIFVINRIVHIFTVMILTEVRGEILSITSSSIHIIVNISAIVEYNIFFSDSIMM
ncbi:MAG: hypothetical protein ACOZBL_01510 [Patescibacteria group bacterium]